jgi:hypothetical protein
MRFGGIASFAALSFAAGCQSPPATPGEAAEAALCPELAGHVDPLEVPFTDKPGTDARIRAFVAAARGLRDVTTRIEQLAIDACTRMRHDLGAPDAPADASIVVQCEPVRALIAKLIADGIQVRISVAAPRCEADTKRQARCSAVSQTGGGAETQVLCNAEAAMYARCSLPSITFASSPSGEQAARLGKTLEDNLPGLLYAEMALAGRLFDHTQRMVAASARVTAEVKDAGPHGLACIGLASVVTAKSAERLQQFYAGAAALFASLDPEIHGEAHP